jgi:hypothetical protein
MKDEVYTRQEIYQVAEHTDHLVKETQLRYHIGKMLKRKSILRVGRNLYIKADEAKLKRQYRNVYSSTAEKIIEFMKTKFPLMDYRIWELIWLNEFLNHQLGNNLIFVEIEKIGCEVVFHSLREILQSTSVLLMPTTEQLLLYREHDSVIINRLITEAPKGKPYVHNVLLEKIIVDLFANKSLFHILSPADFPDAVSEMFRKYIINQTSMFRYAKRRNKAREIYAFLTEETDAELVVEVK